MHLLVIEDARRRRESLERGLREAGYAVDATGEGTEGLWYARTNEYDAIVLDLMLPGIDGMTILHKMRAAGKTTPVLILTAKDELGDRVAGLDRGADDYLTKPFAFEELKARIRALIRRKYNRKNPMLRIGPLEIDTVAKSVRCHGVSIRLTAREYALLELLAMRSGAVVSRTEIWEQLYEFHDDTTSNVVDVYVGYLRKKIETPGTPRLIHTRRGLGYVLEALA